MIHFRSSQATDIGYIVSFYSDFGWIYLNETVVRKVWGEYESFLLVYKKMPDIIFSLKIIFTEICVLIHYE